MRLIPYGKHTVREEDIEEVVKVLRSDWISQGPKIEEFEKAVADYCGAKYAVAVSSGTAALHIAALALGIGPGDEVITSPNTFVATPNSILYAGGRPVFADIDPETFNLDPHQVESKINSNTKGILPVHFAGHPCDMERLTPIARSRKLFVIEDGCHALGARYRVGGRWYQVGSSAHSDACVFSFHPVKSITTGEGGAITTNRFDLYEKFKALRNQGIVRDPEKFLNLDLAFSKRNGRILQAPWYYEVQTLGFNYRMTDFQAALGMAQLSKLHKFVQERRNIALFYQKALRGLPYLSFPKEKDGFRSAWHLYIILLSEPLYLQKAEIVEDLRKKGIGVQVHYIPLHFQPFYRKLGYQRGDFPEVENYYKRALSLPIFPALTKSKLRYVLRTLTSVLEKRWKN